MSAIYIEANEMCLGCPALKGIVPWNLEIVRSVVVGTENSIGSRTIISDASDSDHYVALTATGDDTYDRTIAPANRFIQATNDRIAVCKGPKNAMFIRKCGAAVIGKKIKPYTGITFDEVSPED